MLPLLCLMVGKIKVLILIPALSQYLTSLVTFVFVLLILKACQSGFAYWLLWFVDSKTSIPSMEE